VKILLLTFFHLLISTISFGESIPIGKLLENLQTGNLEKFEQDINESISTTSSNSELADLHKIYGDYHKLCGRIDEAGEKWKKSNQYRDLSYSSNDYHLAWNYALLSNYYYEKINTRLAVTYADSCYHLIKNLNEKEKLEVDIHLIYNILGQSYKQDINKLNYEEILKLYEEIQNYYLKSINFQLNNKLSTHTLANTYHLLGNSFLDLSLVSSQNKKLNNVDLFYSSSMSYYNKAIDIWTELYGSKHYEKGKTLFLTGLLNHYLSDKFPDKIEITQFCFRKAINSFNIERQDIRNVPNKEDLLMLLRYATVHALNFKPNENYLTDIEKLNSQAIYVWLEIIRNNNSINQNQNLAIYNLNPYEEKIRIILEKEEGGIQMDNQEMFDALQHLKNYDIVKANHLEPENDVFSLSVLQDKLKKEDIFIDIQTVSLSSIVLITTITKDKLILKKLPLSILKDSDTLINSIQNFNYELYTEKARYLYELFFGSINIENKNVMICSDGIFQKTPFDALLFSDDEITKKDYTKLDYAIEHTEFSHIWNSSFLIEQVINFDYSLTTFAPDSDSLSSLPFSKQFVSSIRTEGLGTGYSGKSIIKDNILNVKTNILHLSGHGLIDKNQSYFSELVINKERLSLRDLEQVTFIPKLVCINTCNSSLGKTYIGEGVNSFERAFAINGSLSVLSNIWEVDDQASNEIMNLFYHNVNNGNSTNKSLRKAKLEYMSSCNHSILASPYYWAGHKISGQELRFETESEFTFYLIAIISVILLLSLSYILFKRLRAS